MPFYIFFILTCILSASGHILQPCKIKDQACATRSAKVALPKLIAGTPSLGIPPTDPLYMDEIEGNLADMKYKFMNTTITGLKNCDAENVNIDMESSNFRIDLICNDIFLTGDYKVSGRLIILPIEGNGQFSIKGSKYIIGVNSEIKRNEDKDGHSYLKIKSFQLKIEPQIGIQMDFTNLFNGQKELADVMLKYMNENWREVSSYTQDPVFYTIVKKLVTWVNKYLKSVPYEDLFLD